MDELRALWRRLDDAGMDWISAWDHLYEAPPAGGTIPHFEAVATLAAMAVETTNARLGCLVFYVGYRNPGLLAKAAVTIDHLSGGRFELGLGGGWHEWEAAAYGYDFPSVGTRLDMMDEATKLIRGLLTPDPDPTQIARTTFHGEHFRVDNASCLPGPVNGHLPLWIGGVGEKRTLRTTAQWADGWNAAYVPPHEFARLNGVLDSWCERIARDPAEIERSINLVFAMGEDEAAAATIEADLDAQWGDMASRVKGGALLGTPEQAVERILEYADAGADLVNIALRAPFSEAVLDAYLDVVVPAVRSRT
jgi:alkanesulfonate monooxygenase SsuD/methylene tetrahydromethanopterin reductase-like flavin-dependent oxidoreductase (luciferase family)